jgi:predicted membrane GTPase involved in stress response
MKQQTAVEWLIQNLEQQSGSYRGFCNIRTTHEKMIEQAEEMEKERIMTAFMKNLSIEYGVINAVQKAEQYYNETYGGDK